jgi:FtsZ-binding cell division protein ZapB
MNAHEDVEGRHYSTMNVHEDWAQVNVELGPAELKLLVSKLQLEILQLKKANARLAGDAEAAGSVDIGSPVDDAEELTELALRLEETQQELAVARQSIDELRTKNKMLEVQLDIYASEVKDPDGRSSSPGTS